MRRAGPRSIGVCAIRALAIALGAAGCFSDRGLAIEVDVGDTGAATVELYIGKTKCDPTADGVDIDCTKIAPPDGTTALPGTIWFRDDLLPDSARVIGHKATFQVKADSATTLPIVVAAGLVQAADGPHAVGTVTLRDLAIPIHSARVVTTALVPTNPVAPKQTDTKSLSDDRALVWTKQSPASSCVVVEHWVNGQVTRDFVVPIEDPDCDDVAAPECNPAAWHGASAVGGATVRPDCVTAGDASRCVLGNFGCKDDTPDKLACVALQHQVCVPELFCPCTAPAADCIQMKLDGDPTTIPHIRCDVPTTPAPVLGLCSGDNSDMVDLSQVYAGHSCGHQPLISGLALGGFASSRKFGDAEFALSNADDPCAFKISWRQGSIQLADETDRAVILLDAGTGSLLVPVVFQFHSAVGACGIAPFHCMFVDSPGDSVWSCVQ